METYARTRLHTFQLEHEGVVYGAVAQRDITQNVYRIVSVWDQTHQQYLPLNDIEGEYARWRGSLSAITLRSKWAARRRVRQYIRIWARQKQETS